MTVIADLHIHSRYSNSTSPQMELPTLALGAQRKGIDLLGTGDCTQPDWLDTLSSELHEQGDGIYSYEGTSFMVTGEVSLVWKHDDRGRRIHIVLLVPSLDDAMRSHEALSPRGNLVYDGRPMLGLSAPDFCEIVWEQSPDTLLIPAHAAMIWVFFGGTVILSSFTATD